MKRSASASAARQRPHRATAPPDTYVACPAPPPSSLASMARSEASAAAKPAAVKSAAKPAAKRAKPTAVKRAKPAVKRIEATVKRAKPAAKLATKTSTNPAAKRAVTPTPAVEEVGPTTEEVREAIANEKACRKVEKAEARKDEKAVAVAAAKADKRAAKLAPKVSTALV